MEAFVNGVCADGAGAATPPPPGAPPAALSAPGVPGADATEPAPAPAPAPDPVEVSAPAPTPSPAPSPAPSEEDEGGFRWWHKLLLAAALCSVAFVALIGKLCASKEMQEDKEEEDNPLERE